MSAGPFIWFDKVLLKLNQDVLLGTDTLKAALCGDAQALTAAFAGGSGDCRYADLTDELPTANGYTNGGLTLVPSLTQDGTRVTFTVDPMDWTITGTILIKYIVIYDNTTANKDLVMFCDVEEGGGELSVIAGTHLLVQPTMTGLGYWET